MELLNLSILIIAGGIIGLLATTVSELKKRNKQLMEQMKCCDNCKLDSDLDKCPKHNHYTTTWYKDRNLCGDWELGDK